MVDYKAILSHIKLTGIFDCIRKLDYIKGPNRIEVSIRVLDACASPIPAISEFEKLAYPTIDIQFHYTALPTDDEKEALKFCYFLLQNVVLHEFAENFYCDGYRVFDPHGGSNPYVFNFILPISPDWEFRIKEFNLKRLVHR